MDNAKLLNIASVRSGGKDGYEAYNCSADKFLLFVKILKEEYFFDALADLAGMDFGLDEAKRFGCIYHFYSTSRKTFLRVCVYCEDNAKPSLPSLALIYANANWHEREAYDMLGINFEGHPDLRRILMWDAYPHHPLRKDFPLCGKPAPTPPEFDAPEGMKVVPVPMEGGPFHSKAGANTSSEKEPRSRLEF